MSEWIFLGREWMGDGWRFWYEIITTYPDHIIVALGVSRVFSLFKPKGQELP